MATGIQGQVGGGKNTLLSCSRNPSGGLSSLLCEVRAQLSILPTPAAQPATATPLLPVFESIFGGEGTAEFNLNCIQGIGVTSLGDIAVVDAKSHCIKIFNAHGNLKRSFGSKGLKQGQFIKPAALTTVRATGEILLLEASERPRVHVFDEIGRYRRTIDVGYYGYAQKLAVDKRGEVLVVLQVDFTTGFVGVEVVEYRTGVHERTLNISADMTYPTGIAVMHKPKHFLVSDVLHHCVKVFTFHGYLVAKIGDRAMIPYPMSINVGDSGDLFVSSLTGKSYQLVVLDKNDASRVKDAWQITVDRKMNVGFALTPCDKGFVMASTDERVHVYRFGTNEVFPGMVRWSDAS